VGLLAHEDEHGCEQVEVNEMWVGVGLLMKFGLGSKVGRPKLKSRKRKKKDTVRLISAQDRF